MNVSSSVWAMPALAAALAMAAPLRIVHAAAPVAASLEVEVAKNLADHQLIDQWLAEQTGPALAEAGIELGGDAPEVHFTLQVAGEDYDYVVRIQREGPDPATVEARCACSKSDVVSFAVEKLVATSQSLASTTDPATEPTQPDTVAPPPVDDASTHAGPRVGALGIVGIVAIVGGVGASVAGGVLLARGEQDSVLPGDEQQIRTEDHRPGGRAALGVGIGAVALGIVFVALDQTVLKKRRRRVAVTPGLGPRGAALSLTARF